MGRFNYSFAGRYLLTLTGRYDESSVFAAKNKGGFFPSVAVGWNVTNDSFLDNSPVFTTPASSCYRNQRPSPQTGSSINKGRFNAKSGVLELFLGCLV